MLRMAAMIPFAALLTACGTERPRIVLPPAELATCMDEPAAPSLPAVDWFGDPRPVQMQRDVMTLDYILALRSAGGDCRAKVKGLDAWRKAVK